MELTATRAGEVVLRWILGDADNSFIFGEAPDCIELRRRGPTGRRGEATILCGSDLARRPFRESDLKNDIIQCRGGKIGVDAQVQRSGAPSAGTAPAVADGGGNAGSPASSATAKPGEAAPSIRNGGCSTAGAVASDTSMSVFALLGLLWLRRSRGRS